MQLEVPGSPSLSSSSSGNAGSCSATDVLLRPRTQHEILLATADEELVFEAEETLARRVNGPYSDRPEWGEAAASLSDTHPSDIVFKSHWNVAPTRVPRSPGLHRRALASAPKPLR